MTPSRDHKQVRNVAQRVANASGTGKHSNAADELQTLVGGIHSHPFVKEICIRHGQAPVIIADTEDQLMDMRRFTSTATPAHLRSVIGVDIERSTSVHHGVQEHGSVM